MTVKLVGNDENSGALNLGSGMLYMQKFQAISGGSLSELKIKIGAGGNCSTMLALYSDNGGEPDALLTSCADTSLAPGWNTVSVSPASVSDGDYFWLAENNSGASSHPVYLGGVGVGIVRYKALSYNGFAFPDPAGTGYGSSTTINMQIAGWGTAIVIPVFMNQYRQRRS